MAGTKHLDRFYTTNDLRRLLRYGPKSNQIYELIYDKDGRYADDPFPDPIKVGKSYLWHVEEVDAWIARRPKLRLVRKPSSRTESPTPAAVAADEVALPRVVIRRAS